MNLKDSYDGSETPFEGDLSLLWRSLPGGAQVTKATVKLTPLAPPAGNLFEEVIAFHNDQGDWGATRAHSNGFVEVDFHKRRTLGAVVGTSTPGTDLKNSNLQVDVGGLYVEINTKGAIRSPSNGGAFLVPPDGKLPSLTTSKFKLTQNTTSPPPLLDVTSVTVRSVPTNVNVRLGRMAPFWTRLGELSAGDTSPDFADVLKAFLASAKVENGFYSIPVVVHSDTLARFQVDLEIEFVNQTGALPEGLKEVVLPFDYATLPKTQANVLKVDLPSGARVVPLQTTARAIGAFDETRVLYGPTGELQAAGVAVVSPTDSQAQPFSLDDAVAATAVDLLLLATTRTARLSIDLRADLDGKPDNASLLSRPVDFEIAGNVAQQPTWVSVPFPAEFHFDGKSGQVQKRYWIVLQSLDGSAEWSLASAQPGSVGLQHSEDGGFSWHDTTPAGVTGPPAAFFRLRGRPPQFQVPIELQIGTGSNAARVKLDRFQSLRRIDFVLNFPEVADAFSQYLTKAAPAGCSESEHLANGDFAEWNVIGDTIGKQPLPVKLRDGKNPKGGGIAISLDGQWAYAGSITTTEILLNPIDVPCGLAAPGIILTKASAPSEIPPPNVIAIHPNGTRAYVLVNDGRTNEIHLVDLAGANDLGTVSPSNGILGRALALNPNGRQIFVSLIARTWAVAVVDTSELERAILTHTAPPELFVPFISPTPNTNDEIRALAVAPDGTRLYVAIGGTRGSIRMFDLGSGQQVAEIPVGKNPSAIALTPDGTQAIVANRGDNTLSRIDVAAKTLSGSPILPGVPMSLAVSPDGARLFVACATPSSTLNILDLSRGIVTQTIPIDINPAGQPVVINPAGLAITPHGDQIYITDAGSANLAVFSVGTRTPAEWTVTSGQVKLCAPGTAFPEPFVSLEKPEDQTGEPQPKGLSQVVPVSPSCAYDFSFQGFSTGPDSVAEVIWKGQDCGVQKTDSIPIKFIDEQNSSGGKLVLHSQRLTAPAGATQAEVRFRVPAGLDIAGIAKVSLKGSTEALTNGDFTAQEGGQAASWVVSPGTGGSVSLVTVDVGVLLQNSGNENADLSQAFDITGMRVLEVQFNGRALLNPPVQQSTGSSPPENPKVELHWRAGDGSAMGSPVSMEIPPEAFEENPMTGAVPQGAARAEIHLIAPPGTSLEIHQVSVKGPSVTTVPVTFVAQSPGELRVSQAQVAYDRVAIPPPPVPQQGLCSPTPPDREPDEPPCDTCVCSSCQAQSIINLPEAAMTRAGRPAVVGVCAHCGSEMVRIGGPLVPGAPTISFPRFLLRPRLRSRGPVRLEPSRAPSLTDIPGIGEKRAKRLAKAGITTVAELAAAAPGDVANALRDAGVPAQYAPRFIEKARQVLAQGKPSLLDVRFSQ